MSFMGIVPTVAGKGRLGAKISPHPVPVGRAKKPSRRIHFPSGFLACYKQLEKINCSL